MHAVARYSLTDDHYREDYDQWLRYVAKWRRRQPYVAAAFLVSGVFLAFVHMRLSAAVGLVAGVSQLVDVVSHRSRWLKARRRGSRVDRDVQLTFTDEGIEVLGPFSTGQCRWEGIERTVSTPMGLFLIPQDGMHIYIPDRVLEPISAKREIVARVGRAGEREAGS